MNVALFLVMILLVFCWPLVIAFAFLFRKKLKKKVWILVGGAILMPVVGGFIPFSRQHTKESEIKIRKILDERRRAREANFRPGDLQLLSDVSAYKKFYRGKEVKIRGFLSTEPSGLNISTQGCPGAGMVIWRVSVVTSADFKNSDINRYVEILGSMDKVEMYFINAKSIVPIEKLLPSDCE